METQLIKKARELAFDAHEGQMYGQFPFCFHLMEVVRILAEYRYDKENLICAAYLHDTIEDCDIKKTTIKDMFNSEVAELVWTCTGIGKNREERKNDMIKKLTAYPKAIPLKMADRLANIRNCATFNTRLLNMYRKEDGNYYKLFIDTDLNMMDEMAHIFGKFESD